MTKDQKNLIAVGVVALAGWLFFNLDESASNVKKAEVKALKAVEKKNKKQAASSRNRSLIDVLRVATPLLSPVVNAAVDEFKTYRRTRV